MSGTPTDPLGLEAVSQESPALAADTAEPEPSGSGKLPSIRRWKAALHHKIQSMLAEYDSAHGPHNSDESDDEEGTGSESDASGDQTDDDMPEEKAPRKRKSIQLAPGRVSLQQLESAEAFRLDREKAEYVRQQMCLYQPDDGVQRLVIEKAKVPENVPNPPKLDDYFAEALAVAKYGHVKAHDSSLQRMQENVRNILGPLIAIWTSIDATGDAPVPKEALRVSAERAILLTGKAFGDLEYVRRFALIDTFKKSTQKTKSFLKKAECTHGSTLFGKSFERKLRKLTKNGSSSQTVLKALREPPPAPQRQWNSPPPWKSAKRPINKTAPWAKPSGKSRARGRGRGR